MLKYRLVITIGYCKMNLVFDDPGDIGKLLENMIAHTEESEDKVSYDIEVEIIPTKNVDVVMLDNKEE